MKSWGRYLEYAKERDVLRTAELVEQGITRGFMQYDARELEKLAPGVYAKKRARLTHSERVAACATKYPRLIFSLETALWLHGMLPVEPAFIRATIGTHARAPSWIGLEIVRCKESLLEEGIVSSELHGQALRVYSLARTVAECFRFRRVVGVNVGVRALHAVLDEFRFDPPEIVAWAEKLRVGGLVRSHLARWARRDELPELDEEWETPIDPRLRVAPRAQRGRPPSRTDPPNLFTEIRLERGTLPESTRRRVRPRERTRELWEDD